MVLDLLQGILPAAEGFGLVVLGLEVDSGGTDEVAVVVRLLHGRERFARQHIWLLGCLFHSACSFMAGKGHRMQIEKVEELERV
jgi:hypothetical protein